MIVHLQPAPGTSRFLCCFKSTLMLNPEDRTTNDPANITCDGAPTYEDFERVLLAPMNRHAEMQERIKKHIWTMLVARKYDNAYQVKPAERRAFLEEFGQALRRLEDEEDGKDTLLMIRKEQIKQLKALGKAHKKFGEEVARVLSMILLANPEYPLEQIPPPCCPTCGVTVVARNGNTGGCENLDTCQQRAAMMQHNKVIRSATTLIERGPQIEQ